MPGLARLAAGAKERAAVGLPKPLDGLPAAPAALPLALEDAQEALIVAHLPVGVHEIGERGAPVAHAGPEHGAHRGGEPSGFAPIERVAAPGGVDARPEERLADVDVAEP